VADLNVREQGDICGHMSTDIPIVPDRVGAGRLRVQEDIFSALGGKDILIEPTTSGQLALSSGSQFCEPEHESRPTTR